MPSVTTSTRVRWLEAPSRRTWYPTRSPSSSPRSEAIREAAERAAMRRGSRTRIDQCEWRSSSARGTAVVLPAPGGACSTRFGALSSDSTICGSSGVMGSVSPSAQRRGTGARGRATNRGTSQRIRLEYYSIVLRIEKCPLCILCGEWRVRVE
eukprot:scaffold140497_cov29-Tisochrysis_lutea.AAC.6